MDILEGINSNCIDLIYLDPPFNKNKKFTAPIGSSAEGATFSDIFREKDVKDEWVITINEDHPELYHYLNGIKGVGNHYNYCYLVYMAIRLIECHRVMKETGSLYLHCDPTMSHYLKIVLDCIFGESNFQNEIVWCYNTQGKPKKGFAKKHDQILYYVKDNREYVFNKITITPNDIKRYNKIEVDTKRKYQIDGKGYKYYLDEGRYCPDYWDIPALISLSKERTGYPTQKPVALLERIIKASSNKNDIVLDPFCGCATTCVAAEKLERKWIGIDVSHKAHDLVKLRLDKELPSNLLRKEPYYYTSPPKRDDQGVDYREKKYIYIISHEKYPGEYKVGTAKNVKSRLNTYQTSDPNRQYKIEFSHLTPDFRSVEKYIHDTFPKKHEWVQAELAEIKMAINNWRPSC